MTEALRWPAGIGRTIRVALVARSPLVARGLKYVLQTSGSVEVVATARETGELEVSDVKPEVILVDVDDAPGAVEDAVAACNRVSPQSRVAVLSSQIRPRAMQRALGANADAYIVKDTAPAILEKIVHSLAAGESYADPRIAGALLRRRPSRPTDAYDLSSRETEIVRLIADGLSNREIGARLSLSEKTIKNHVSHILAKLKVSARSGVAVYAVRRGIVS